MSLHLICYKSHNIYFNVRDVKNIIRKYLKIKVVIARTYAQIQCRQLWDDFC